jgi:hypothetical protein
MHAGANYMGVLAVLPGTYMLVPAGYKGTAPGGRLEEVHFKPGEILYISGRQPRGEGRMGTSWRTSSSGMCPRRGGSIITPVMRSRAWRRCRKRRDRRGRPNRQP